MAKWHFMCDKWVTPIRQSSPWQPGTAPEVYHPSSCHIVVGMSMPGPEICCCEAVPGLAPPFGLFLSGTVAAIDWDSQRGSHGCTPGCQRGQAPSCGVSGVQQAIQRAGGTWAAPMAARLGHICTPKQCPVRAGSSIAAPAATSPPEGGRVFLWGWGRLRVVWLGHNLRGWLALFI